MLPGSRSLLLHPSQHRQATPPNTPQQLPNKPMPSLSWPHYPHYKYRQYSRRPQPPTAMSFEPSPCSYTTRQEPKWTLRTYTCTPEWRKGDARGFSFSDRLLNLRPVAGQMLTRYWMCGWGRWWRRGNQGSARIASYREKLVKKEWKIGVGTWRFGVGEVVFGWLALKAILMRLSTRLGAVIRLCCYLFFICTYSHSPIFASE